MVSLGAGGRDEIGRIDPRVRDDLRVPDLDAPAERGELRPVDERIHDAVHPPVIAIRVNGDPLGSPDLHPAQEVGRVVEEETARSAAFDLERDGLARGAVRRVPARRLDPHAPAAEYVLLAFEGADRPLICDGTLVAAYLESAVRIDEPDALAVEPLADRHEAEGYVGAREAGAGAPQLDRAPEPRAGDLDLAAREHRSDGSYGRLSAERLEVTAHEIVRRAARARGRQQRQKSREKGRSQRSRFMGESHQIFPPASYPRANPRKHASSRGYRAP